MVMVMVAAADTEVFTAPLLSFHGFKFRDSVAVADPSPALSCKLGKGSPSVGMAISTK
uniref:Uncharacterized protein n=1 Tax=Aegilops tauschii TaxID=37682 RepID=R7W0C7_AEGTA